MFTPKNDTAILPFTDMGVEGPIEVENMEGTEKLVNEADPIEDYFTLVTSSVKLNSPYMDTVCTISTKDLYSLALEQNIPFHKWHSWVENKLTNEYIQSVYEVKEVSDVHVVTMEHAKGSIFPF